MTIYWYHKGSVHERLIAEDRLERIEFDGWGVRAVWRLECGACGNDFEHHQPQSRYCSDECRVIGQREGNRRRVAAHRKKSGAAHSDDS